MAHLDGLRSHPVPAVAAAAGGAGQVDDSGQRWEAAASFADSFWDVVKVVTAFTLAHSITLSLAALGVVVLPSRLVESAIALSVVLAALNNLWPVV